MKANWSLVLNIVLFFGVIIAIARLVRLRNKVSTQSRKATTPNIFEGDEGNDDIISVRKLADDESDDLSEYNIKLSTVSSDDSVEVEDIDEAPHTTMSLDNSKASKSTPEIEPDPNSMLMIFLVAKDEQVFAGYELLQAVLASGLRFGEGNIFHKHQNNNGQGTILFSLAAATAEGTFDLQNMGSYSVRGLCLYMHTSGNASIDSERFDLMHTTAKLLAEDLQARLLDDKQQVMDEAGVERYHASINGAVEETV